jgi:type VI secretion system protein ImpK
MTTFANALKEAPRPDGSAPPQRKSAWKIGARTDERSAGSRAPGAGIRDLLRDTALQVTTLSQGGNVEAVSTLRTRCEQLMTAFSASLEQRGVPADVREDALNAQCGLLDETVLRHLPVKDKPEWDARPLQVERNGRHDAGDRVFDRLAERMREVPPNVDLLECYSAILGLDFMGRYAREGEAKRSALIASLDAQLEKLRPAHRRTFIADRPGWRLADWFYRISPWAIASLGCVIAAIVYLVWGHALDLQLANLLPTHLPSKP